MGVLTFQSILLFPQEFQGVLLAKKSILSATKKLLNTKGKIKHIGIERVTNRISTQGKEVMFLVISLVEF